MTSVRDLVTQERATVSYAKRIDALSFIRFMLEEISVPAMNTCAKSLREGNDRAKTLFLQSGVDKHQSKPMRVNMKVTAPSVPKSDIRIEFALGFSDELLRTSLVVLWKLMKPSRCPIRDADSILRATQELERELNSDCNLRDLSIAYILMTTACKSNRGNNVELPGWGPEDWVEPGSCLAKVCGLEGQMCGAFDCVKSLAKQHKQLTVLLRNIVMKAETDTELIADCDGGTEGNLVTAVGALEFYSMFGS